MSKWTFKKEITKVSTKWVKLICEKWLDEEGNELDYWRVEKPDSIIVIPIQNEHFICPKPFFRVGINSCTLDFPGGRLKSRVPKKDMAYSILLRELGIPKNKIISLTPLNKKKWIVNSSFSNQGLWVFTAQIHPGHKIPKSKIGATEKATTLGANKLLKKLSCLQCRAALHEWKNSFSTIKDIKNHL